MEHGIRRTAAHQNSADRRSQEAAKIKSYTELCAQVIARKRDGDLSNEALELTTRMLALNPEFYTVWNYRRNIYLQFLFPASTPAQIHAIIAGDLTFTFAALRQHPKVYWIWNHRRWCLENIPEAPDAEDPLEWKRTIWARELFVVEKMLDADARNFHAWNYRRYVLASLPPSAQGSVRTPESEIAYTTRKIEANFSNYSAWHQRSKVFGVTGALDDPSAKDAEFEFVNQAMYTDPNDQSAWLYHRWLVGNNPDARVLRREIQVIEDLLAEEPSSKWCLESLVHYKLLLQSDNASDADALRKSCTEMLSKLTQIDPARKERYQSLGDTLST